MTKTSRPQPGPRRTSSARRSGREAFVSIIIACRNEEKFIAGCLDSVLANDYPKKRLEILVVDGRSEDRTRAIVRKYEQRHRCVRLLDNPKRITPSAFNIGVRHACGEVIMILGSHAVYPRDYVSKCVRYLYEFDADNVGGVLQTRPRKSDAFGQAVTRALSHRFGVGNARFRTGTRAPEWVDTVFGGCYRREVFQRVGLFNEELVFSADMEFNRRLKRTGGRILLVPEIHATYFARQDFKSFLKHNLRNGFWVTYPFKFVRHMPISWRHLVPLAFVGSLLLSTLLAPFVKPLLFAALFILLSYVSANLYVSWRIALAEKRHGLVWLLPVVFASIHFSYGLASLWGWLKVLASRRYWRRFLPKHP